jgi:hypothetical protein
MTTTPAKHYYDNPIPTRFLALIDCYKTQAQLSADIHWLHIFIFLWLFLLLLLLMFLIFSFFGWKLISCSGMAGSGAPETLCCFRPSALTLLPEPSLPSSLLLRLLFLANCCCCRGGHCLRGYCRCYNSCQRLLLLLQSAAAPIPRMMLVPTAAAPADGCCSC